MHSDTRLADAHVSVKYYTQQHNAGASISQDGEILFRPWMGILQQQIFPMPLTCSPWTESAWETVSGRQLEQSWKTRHRPLHIF